jgi:TetR/AcrR family transcriptional regulator, transcriptional repressor of bet genes
MPKLGMEPIRRAALVEATIAEIADLGTLDVTVAGIARRAGMSSALAHHYFGAKDQMLLAAMRHILRLYGTEVRMALLPAAGPRARIEAVIAAGFGAVNFRPEIIAAWLNFYVLARSSTGAARLLAIYQHRLRSNLAHDLRPLVGGQARALAERIAALIDGLYLRQALRPAPPDGPAAIAHVLAALDHEITALRLT